MMPVQAFVQNINFPVDKRGGLVIIDIYLMMREIAEILHFLR